MCYIVAFWVNNFELVLFVIFLFVIGKYVVDKFFQERAEKRNENNNSSSLSKVQYNNEIIEKNYQLIRNCIFITLKNLAQVINIIPPNSVQNIDSPNHSARVSNFVVYDYVALKKDFETDMDLKQVKDIVNSDIIRNLTNHNYSGISQDFFIYEGNAYAYLEVYKVTDMNMYITISVVIVNANYCEYKKQALTELLSAEQTRAEDGDF